jgi:hypothetical protein
MGNAEAALAWKGFSALCFKGEWKGGSVTDATFTAKLSSLEVQVNCYNVQADGSTFPSCQPGGGNAGDLIVSTDATTDPNKVKGTIYTVGNTEDGWYCISLDKFDHHFNPDHTHMCLPYDNKNKFEVEGSARISKINVDWKLTKPNGQIQRRGIQECYYPGTFDLDLCEPQHDLFLDCPINEEYR